MNWFRRLFHTSPRQVLPPRIFFTNTLTGTKDLFISQRPGTVSMYSCGPTVYAQAHIGNLRSYVFSDTIARVLSEAGFHVSRVINITDVGHLVGDGDEGEDKMAVGAAREHKTPEEIADQYTNQFLDDLHDLNIDTTDIQFPRATDYIKEQIALAKVLEEKGFAYRLQHGLAFDTSRFPGYGRLGNQDAEMQQVGARVEADPEKRHPRDFWLWRAARPGDLQQWDSPWGRGNPGWHIECSAMVRSLLGQEIDIHTGGEDHIAIHHNNEIAQSEAVSGRTFVHYWLHNAFLTMQGEKAAKSLGNVIYLSDIVGCGYHPLALRMLYLQAQYRSPLSFSWDALSGAASGLSRLWKQAERIADESRKTSRQSQASKQFVLAMRDDLATPQALSVLWESLKSEEYAPEEKWHLIETADAHLGLSLVTPPERPVVAEQEISKSVQELLGKREIARQARDFAQADHLRTQIEESGYHVEDAPDGPVLTKASEW